MSRVLSVAMSITLLVTVGCAAGPGRPTDRGLAPDAGGSGAPSVVTLVQLNSVKNYGPWDFANTSGGGAALAEIHTTGLVTDGVTGGLEPRLAEKLPTFDDGSIVILPDGRMRTTWTLRPNVKWHDGRPLTADDLAFSWQVAMHPELVSAIDSSIRASEAAEALDARTLVITWRSTFYRALEIGHRDLWPMPRHILADPFQGDKQAFQTLPYFTTDYVALGPFRLVDYGLGEEQVFERFDDYFLGPPKLDRIVIRTIPDINTALANLMAGSLDMTTERTLGNEMFLRLRDEWRLSGAGTVLGRQENWWYMWFQFDPQWARPLEMGRDVRIRRGLLQGYDRDAIREALFAGLPEANADTFMLQKDPRAAVVGETYARFRYDPARAAQELADAGWRRGADGRLRNSAGEQVQIEVRGGELNTQELALIANDWRKLGIDVAELIPAPALGRDREWKSKFPGLEISARGTAEKVIQYLDSRRHSTAENRWNGANVSHYVNPNLDRLLDQLFATLDERDQALALRDMAEILATDLPTLPVYFSVAWAAVSRNVRALTDDYAATRGPGSGIGLVSRNAHLWERVR